MNLATVIVAAGLICLAAAALDFAASVYRDAAHRDDPDTAPRGRHRR